ncbi:MAG: amino acid permease [Candidatus Poribacteria bacterium]|nr:amino acid permease [Candidatus Poribacteria bacterium]
MPADRKTPGRFGTFGGVFTPCVLTILGVIMFLRLGNCVGEAGMLRAAGIVLLSSTITLLTALSLSAISTNIRVGGGGAYFLISRSLGVEFGSAIGIVFFLAQAVSVAMYVVGFSEELRSSVPALADRFTEKQIATAVHIVVLICVFIGAGWTIRLQYFILATLGLSLASFTIGVVPDLSFQTMRENLGTNFSEGENFFSVFAIFFPAVTGIMAGANMSGDLRDPGRSIPRGTLLAIGVTTVVYVSLVVMMAGALPLQNLAEGNRAMSELAQWGALITAGALAATSSSALGSMMGAPRILQQFGVDDVFRVLRFFGRGSGKANEPRRAILLTFVIAQIGVMVGDLNAIAPVITMFFLITYGVLNFATFSEAFARNPSYRPRFRFSHWSTALLGAASCAVVMFLVDPVWAVISIALMAAIYWLIRRHEIEWHWGDVQSGGMYERARRNLLRLEEVKYHPKNWRPTILAPMSGEWDQRKLAAYGHWFACNRGILSLAQIIVGDPNRWMRSRDIQEQELRKFIHDQGVSAFTVAVVSPDIDEGIRSLAQCHGIGGIRPNTTLIQWPNDLTSETAQTLCRTLQTVTQLDCSVVAMRYEENGDPWQAPDGPVDVWWSGGANGSLMLLLAHLLTQSSEWRARPIRLIRVAADESEREATFQNLRELSKLARIEAEPVVVISSDIGAALRRESRDSSLTFVGFPRIDNADEQDVEQMNGLTRGLKTVAFVRSAGGMQLDA